MAYVELAPLFCAAIEIGKDIVNNIMNPRLTATDQPLEKVVETKPSGNNRKSDQNKFQADKHWSNIPARARQAALSHVEVYLDDFISVIQGVPEERKQMTRHLFSSIDYLFRPNNPLDMAMEEPIFF